MKAQRAVLDGEVVACDVTGRMVFRDLLARKATCFIAFDALWLDGDDLRDMPLVERKQRLKAILPKQSNIVCEPVSVIGDGKRLFAAVQQHDLEGIVAKRLADSYRSTTTWWR